MSSNMACGSIATYSRSYKVSVILQDGSSTELLKTFHHYQLFTHLRQDGDSITSGRVAPSRVNKCVDIKTDEAPHRTVRITAYYNTRERYGRRLIQQHSIRRHSCDSTRSRRGFGGLPTTQGGAGENPLRRIFFYYFQNLGKI